MSKSRQSKGMALLIANNPVLTNMVKIISKLLFFPMAFFIASSSLAWAAPVEVYRGVLGSADVVMELGESQADGTRKGRYFYLRHGADIPLRGRLDQLAEAQPLTGELLEKRLHATT